MIYLVALKTEIVKALRATFVDTYPEADFRGLWTSIEYPVAQASYPGIWVNYEDTEEVTIAGIAHTELVLGSDNEMHPVTRSRFGGVISLTCVAMSSLERDRLYDELVRTLMFARKEEGVSPFRTSIEQNDLVAMNIDFDKVQPGGDNAAPGTPWGTDDWIYERSVSVNVIGEFISSYALGGLVNLSKIIVQGYVEGTPEPAFPDHPAETLDPGLPGSVPAGFEIDVFDRGDWH